jgi:hypothetical protein
VTIVDKGTPSSSVTEEAIRIIDAAPADGPFKPASYVLALPLSAASLARYLESKDAADAARKFEDADLKAIQAQLRFKQLGWTAAYATFLIAALGGLLLYLLPARAVWTNFGLLSATLLGVALFCASAIYLFKPYQTWRSERSNAEEARLQIFSQLMASVENSSNDGELPLLALQLECFRRHLLNDQREYYQRRAQQHRRTMRQWRFFRALSLLLLALAGLPQVPEFLDTFQFAGSLPDALRELSKYLPSDKKLYVLAWIYGLSLQYLLFTLAVISPAARIAKRYETMCSQLDLALSRLPGVRTAAERGDRGTVTGFTEDIMASLRKEVSGWSEIL